MYEQPYETIGPMNNTPYLDMTREELSKAHAELATAQTTIKNLLEAVVNFSHTNNVPIQTQEEVEIIRPPTPKCTAPQANTSSEPRWVKSANPTVIKPTRNTASSPQQPQPNTPPKPKANPHCLILQFNPPIPETEHKNADMACKEINTLLDNLEVPTYFRAMAVNWSRNGNPIITTTASGTAEDLLSHIKDIGRIFTNNTLILALPDMEYVHAKVNMLNTKDFEGNICNSKEVHEELMEYVIGYDMLRHASPPCWLGNLEYLEAKSHSSMVFNFTTTEDRERFISYGPIWVFNQQCTITPYEE